MSNPLADAASKWIGKEFKPGQPEQCCNFVRQCLREIRSPMAEKVTVRAWDGIWTSLQLASSLAGDDIGKRVRSINDLQRGDLIFQGSGIEHRHQQSLQSRTILRQSGSVKACG